MGTSVADALDAAGPPGARVASEVDATLSTVLRWILAAAGAAMVVLIVSGVYLVWNYRPSEALSWSGLSDIRIDSWPGTMHDVHRYAARIFVLLGVGAAVLAVVIAARHRRFAPGLFGAAFVVAALAASVSGGLLVWDQVALWAVTVGVDYKGYTKIISGHNVRYIIIDGKEISPSSFRSWFFSHVAVIPVVLIGLALVLLWTTRGRAARRQQA